MLLIAQSSWFLAIQWPDTTDLHSCCVRRDLHNIILWNAVLHRPVCNSVCIGKFTITGSILLICKVLKAAGGWLYEPAVGRNEQMSPPSNITHFPSYTFLFVLTERLVSCLQMNFNSTFKWEMKMKDLPVLSWASMGQNFPMHIYVLKGLSSTLRVRKLASQIQGLSICHTGQSKRKIGNSDSLEPLLIFY